VLKLGQTIGTYEVGDVLGSGGFATVYKARHTVLGSDHAIKVLSADFARQRELRDRFLSEGKILSRLRHPNIVRVTDVLVEPGIAALVMDFVDGETLEAALDGRNEPMSLDEIHPVFLPVLDAVGHAHDAGVIHRDLKPANIILSTGPDGRTHPVVVDFGIAKLTENGKLTKVGATRTSMQMGTVGYMSPEQIRNAKDVDERTDIFSLGCILYEMAADTPAFSGSSEFDVMRAIVDNDADLSMAPKKLRSVIKRCLGPLSSRPASCAAFAQALSLRTESDAAIIPRPEPKPTKAKPEPSTARSKSPRVVPDSSTHGQGTLKKPETVVRKRPESDDLHRSERNFVKAPSHQQAIQVPIAVPATRPDLIRPSLDAQSTLTYGELTFDGEGLTVGSKRYPARSISKEWALLDAGFGHIILTTVILAPMAVLFVLRMDEALEDVVRFGGVFIISAIVLSLLLFKRFKNGRNSTSVILVIEGKTRRWSIPGDQRADAQAFVAALRRERTMRDDASR
jgi:serine/threonine protein kinase